MVENIPSSLYGKQGRLYNPRASYITTQSRSIPPGTKIYSTRAIVRLWATCSGFQLI